MIRLPSTILVATEPTNMHLSFDRLMALVRDQLGAELTEDTVVVFHNRRRTHVKLLLSGVRGLWILYKRLSRGTYRIPLAIPEGAKRVRVSRRELEVLLEGVDRAMLCAARRRARQRER